ncbi:MAG: SulP family inorganic anion transporter [Burkholderiaceae bacterium]
MSRIDRLARVFPGLPALLNYRRSDFRHDLAAGLAVAAVGIPGSVANAQLAGLPPVVGLCASTLPMIAYALFGTSRQLLMGPGAAGAAIVAAGVAPLAMGDALRYHDLAIALTFFTGLIYVGASFLRLGALADFLSKPILVGFMNGVAITVVLSQIGRLFGIRIDASGIVPRALEFLEKLPGTHWPTLSVGLGTMLLLALAPRFLRPLPGALVAIVVAALAVHWLDLGSAGVATLGFVAGGLPAPRIPQVPLDQVPVLIAEAAGLALVLFSTTMLAARSFADRNGYTIDADREVAALGAANIAAAFVQGFAVNGTSSRTAVGEAAGGRTQVTGIVAALAFLVVIVAFTAPLQFIPSVSLAAVLIMAGASLFNWSAVAAIRRIDSREFWIAMTATVGVVIFGVMNAILVAVALAILSFVQLASRPKIEILGTISGQPGFHSLARHAEASTPPGLVLFRFDGPIIFFSAPYFKREVQKAALAAGPGLRWFVIDLLPVNMVDATGVYAIQEAFDLLRERGVVVGAAARDTQWADWAAERGLEAKLGRTRFFATLGEAVRAYETEVISPSRSA